MQNILPSKTFKKLFLFLILFLTNFNALAIFRDSVIVLVNRYGYEVDVIKPGRYVVVRNFSGVKVIGRVEILDHRTLKVGRTVVPIRNISRLTVKSSLYPVSKSLYNAGKYLMSDFVKKMFQRFGFQSAGAAALLFFVILLLIAVVFFVLGLLIIFVSLPGLLVGKTYDTRKWKIYIKPRR